MFGQPKIYLRNCLETSELLAGMNRGADVDRVIRIMPSQLVMGACQRYTHPAKGYDAWISVTCGVSALMMAAISEPFSLMLVSHLVDQGNTIR